MPQMPWRKPPVPRDVNPARLFRRAGRARRGVGRRIGGHGPPYLDGIDGRKKAGGSPPAFEGTE